MSFAWTQFLDLARALEKDPPDGQKEAYYRSAISRAYYAAFHSAREYLELKGLLQPNQQNVHEEVRWLFATSSELGARNLPARIAEDLGRLRRDRNNADYEPSYLGGLKAVRGKAEEALKTAQRIIANIDSLTR